MRPLHNIRYVTYAILLAIGFVVFTKTEQPTPVELTAPPYRFQALEEMNGVTLPESISQQGFIPKGGSPAGADWQYSEGPDFDVWRWYDPKRDLLIGCYIGYNPNIDIPPNSQLIKGRIGRLKVLWWKHTEEYRTIFEAVCPLSPNGQSAHFWIVSHKPDQALTGLEALQNLELVPKQPNKSL